MSERQTKAGNQITLSLSLTLTLSHYLTLSHSHTHSISHSITLDMLNNFCFHLYAQNSLSHSLTISHSHTLSISHSLTLDMLNNFCFHVYAQKSLFIAENCNVFFYLSLLLTTLSPDIRVHRAGSQLKTIAIFGYKQRLLSIEMKTKVVQHVPTINISI